MKMYQLHSPSYFGLLLNSAERAADAGTIAVSTIDEVGKRVNTSRIQDEVIFHTETLSCHQDAYHLHDQGLRVQELH